MGRNYAVDELNSGCKRAIENALLELMKDKPFSCVSISEITKKAGVSRNAYYRNFDSKESIIRTYLFDIASEFFKTVKIMHTKSYYIELFSEFKKYSEQLCLLYSSGLVYPIFDVFLEFSKQGAKSGLFAPHGETYAAGGMFFIVLRWFEGGMKESPEEMANIISVIRNKSILNDRRL